MNCTNVTQYKYRGWQAPTDTAATQWYYGGRTAGPGPGSESDGPRPEPPRLRAAEARGPAAGLPTVSERGTEGPRGRDSGTVGVRDHRTRPAAAA